MTKTTNTNIKIKRKNKQVGKILQQLKKSLTPEVRLRNVNLLLRFENSLYNLFLEVNSFLTNVDQR
jgi:hypothetical protein